MDKTKLEKQMKKFEGYLMIDRGLSKITAGGYCRCVSISLRRMKKFSPQYADIKEHIGWMLDGKFSYSHLVNTSIALEHFTRFMGDVVKLSRPKKPKRLIKDVLSEAEVSRLLSAAGNIRIKALISLLAYSGIRNQEFCNLKLDDIDLGANQVLVRDGKNRQDGVVNISAECTRILIDYLREHPREKNEFLFTTLTKRNQLKTADVRKTIRVVAKRANIGRRVFPHLMRHALASNLLNRGASLMMIQQQLRHRHIESTMVYVISRPIRNKSEYDFHKPAYV
jgi:site-specific recombinase XerD